MKTIVKKATAIALALVMILAFTACGGGEDAESGETGEPEAAAETTEQDYGEGFVFKHGPGNRRAWRDQSPVV